MCQNCTWRWKETTEENIIKSIINLFKLKKENETIKDRIIRYIRTLFEQEEEKDYYKAIRVRNFWNNIYIEYEMIERKTSNKIK